MAWPPSAEGGCGLQLRVRDRQDVRKAIVSLEENARVEAVKDDGEVREGAWVAEITDGLDLSAWPEGSRVSCAKSVPTQAPSSASSTRSKDCATPPSSAPTNGLPRPLHFRSPVSKYATAPTPVSRTGYARPRRPDCVTCPQVGAREPRLARVRARRLRPRRLVQAHLLFRRARPRSLRDRRLSLPRFAHGRPHRPGRSRRAPTPRSHLGLVQTTRTRLYAVARGA
jgi:hypothetical protein